MADNDGFDMIPITGSSRVTSLGYNDETQQMRAVFPSGRSAVYSGVPKEVFGQVVASPSVGSAFGAMIVGAGFPFTYEG